MREYFPPSVRCCRMEADRKAGDGCSAGWAMESRRCGVVMVADHGAGDRDGASYRRCRVVATGSRTGGEDAADIAPPSAP